MASLTSVSSLESSVSMICAKSVLSRPLARSASNAPWTADWSIVVPSGMACQTWNATCWVRLGWQSVSVRRCSDRFVRGGLSACGESGFEVVGECGWVEVGQFEVVCLVPDRLGAGVQHETQLVAQTAGQQKREVAGATGAHQSGADDAERLPGAVREALELVECDHQAWR